MEYTYYRIGEVSQVTGISAEHKQEIDAVFAEELGLQLFPYMDNAAFCCITKEKV